MGKKKLLRRLCALSLAGVMVLGAGCTSDSSSSSGNESTGGSTESSSASTGSSSSESSSVAGIEGWTAFENTVTLEIPIYDRGAEGIADLNDNYYTNWLQETFGDTYNIDLEFIPINRSDPMTDYALLAASGSLPSFLMEYDYDKLATWASEGYLQTYDLDEFAQIAPTYYAMVEASGNLNYTDILDGTYYVPADRSYWNSTYTYITVYRQDWVEAAGYDTYPSTYEEELEMLAKIVELGLSDYPLGGQQTAGAGIDQTYAYREIPMEELDWVMYGDYQYPALSSDWTYTLLKRQNEYYNSGYLNPEYFTIDSETAKSYFVNGMTMSYSGYISSSMDWLTSFYENNPDATLAVRVNGFDGEGGFRTNNPFGMLIGFSHEDDADEMKAVMMYLEWMCQDDVLFTMQWGLEGETFNYNSDGNPEMISDYSGDYLMGYNGNIDYWCVVDATRVNGEIEDTIYGSLPHDLPDDFTDQVIELYNNQVGTLTDQGYAITDCMFGASIESVSEYGEALLSLYAEYRDELVMCDPDEFDSLYEELSQKYLDAGYQAIIDERAELYNEGLTTTLPSNQKK